MGYWLNHAYVKMGISEARAVWVCNWFGIKVRERRVALSELDRGVGSLGVFYWPAGAPPTDAGPFSSGGPPLGDATHACSRQCSFFLGSC